jgi:hypothetical protein
MRRRRRPGGDMAYIGHTVVKERESCILWGDTTSGPGGGEGQAVSRLGHGVCMVGQGGGYVM